MIYYFFCGSNQTCSTVVLYGTSVIKERVMTGASMPKPRQEGGDETAVRKRILAAQRVADQVVSLGGSWTFIIAFAVSTAIYSAVNVWLRARAWDPYPFILLNLILSLLAAIQAPLIMMSQNSQDRKDRVRNELDYAVNRRAESEIQGLARKLNLLGEQMGDMEEMLRQRRNGG